MTESLGHLHEFETQRPDQQNNLGIPNGVPSTVEIVAQKRSAMTTRSMKNRQRATEQKETGTDDGHGIQQDCSFDLVNNENNTTDAPSENSETNSVQRPILNVVHDNSPIVEKAKSSPRKKSDHRREEPRSPMIDEPRTNISTSIGPARSSPSPSISHRYQTSYFASMQQERVQSSPSDTTESTPPNRLGSEDINPDVRFMGSTVEQKKSEVEETYL